MTLQEIIELPGVDFAIRRDIHSGDHVIVAGPQLRSVIAQVRCEFTIRIQEYSFEAASRNGISNISRELGFALNREKNNEVVLDGSTYFLDVREVYANASDRCIYVEGYAHPIKKTQKDDPAVPPKNVRRRAIEL